MQPMLPSLLDVPGRSVGAYLYALPELTLRLNRLAEPQRIFECVVEWVGQLDMMVAALRMRPDGAAFQFAAAVGLPQPALVALWAMRLAPDDASLAWAAVRRGQALLVADPPGAEQFAELRELARYSTFLAALALPLLADDHCFGVLICFAARPETLGPPAVAALDLLARHTALAMDHARVAAELRSRAAAIEQREAVISQRHANLRRAYDLVVSERRTLATVLDSVSDAVLLIDLLGMVQLGNPAVEAALNIHPDELIGHLFHQSAAPDALVELVQRARAQRAPQEGELTLADRRVFHVSVTPIHTFDGPVQGYLALLKDITYFKRLDEMKSRFVATVSHDIKSPLNIINGYVELLGLEGPLNPEQRSCVTNIRHSVRRLMGLVTNLLDLGRIEAGVGVQMGLCQIDAIAQAAVEHYRLVANEKQIDLALQPAPGLPPVWGDEMRLRQVVDNLLSNALTYTPRGGTIRLLAEATGQEVLTRVQDSGIGIGASDLPHIFDPFFRAGGAKSMHADGTGLGLAIVKRIVEEHGGAIGVESAAGGGSTFWFSLPRAVEG